MFITNLTATPSTGVLVNGSPSGSKNDFGVIKNAGTVASSDFTSQGVGFDGNVSITTVVSGAANGVSSAKSSHSFNEGTEIQMKSSATVAGVEEGSILFGGSDSSNKNRSINQANKVATKYYKTAIRTNKWNELEGTFDAGYPEVGNTGAFSIADGVDEANVLAESGTDVAANPTSAAPGRMTFIKGNPVPFSTGYKPRNLE